ncbi:unnamed protein product [Macrosiphum euphorbiae]|uniref:Integrase catalytic domain-containing protein n=1 Tax=Macrosiphum euphorbiae TaxID=13131 RepID=A0AAV0Y6L2_9HEMI|nr:unnamed protein product [Macrosiphum euphorbiae]
MAAELKDLIGRRGVMKRQIIAFQKFFDSGNFTDASTRMELSMRTTRLEASYGDFLAGQTQIELLDCREEQLAERSAVETAYYAAISPAMVLLEAAQTNLRRASQTSSIQGAAEYTRLPNTESAIRLPPISLPEFDGDYKKWLNYRDTFDSFVHGHKDLSDIQKLHYLKSSLRNEAAQVIESLETTAANYLPAWEQLRERYDNHRKMVGGHIHALCSMPSITKVSSASLRSHQNGINSHLRALTALKLPVEHWDAIIIHLMVEKLDVESHRLWESSRSSASLPSIQEYLSFLNQRCLTLESIETRSNYAKVALPSPYATNNKQLAPKKRSYTTAFAATDKSVSSCTLCNGQHALYACQGFLGIPASERREHVRSKRLCYNCLRPDHMSRQLQQTAVLLSTAVVLVSSPWGTTHSARSLLDSGSQCHFITSLLVKRLGLQGRNSSTSIIGITQSNYQSTRSVLCQIKSRVSTFCTTLEFIVIPKIIGELPVRSPTNSIQIPGDIQLADPGFWTPGSVEMLLGAEIFYQLIRPGQVKQRSNPPLLFQNTLLGWIASGNISQSNAEESTATAAMALATDNLDQTIQSFWEREEVNPVHKLTGIESRCEETYKTHTRRNADWRYTVPLLVDYEKLNCIGDTRGMAKKRFYIMERRMQCNPKLHKEYVHFMREYINLGHMKEDPTSGQAHPQEFPLAATAVSKDFYVDDVLTGADTLAEALELRDQLIQLCDGGKFKLRKWCANHPSLLKNLPPEDLGEIHKFTHERNSSSTKTLGTYWQPRDDEIHYTMRLFNDTNTWTKHRMVSEMARLFDPLGLIGPVVVQAKILEIRIPRRIIQVSEPTDLQLHIFCDASEAAYGACVYIRSKGRDNVISCELLCSRSRVAPLKVTTIPRHPIILNADDPLTRLLVDYEHRRLMHAGPQHLLASLQRRYWIFGGRNAVRLHTHKCMKCYRWKIKAATQLMGSLPAARVNPSPAFHVTGLDYAGPISIRHGGTRSRVLTKAYVALFVCFSTRAIHLELVSDLTSLTFLAALRRFISRRGRPIQIHSDNGTNFIGANRLLGEFLNNNSIRKGILEYSHQEGIDWRFIPPHAPHFGGLWEAGVKSTKYHLRRCIGDSILNFEELHTVLVQIEAVLNSRPVMAVSDDPDCLEALTPGHFLIGRPLTTFPEPTLLDEPTISCPRRRWDLVQRMFQQFWLRWRRDYVNSLQQRPKWSRPMANFKIGDLVILKEDNQSPLDWHLGRIIQLHQGADGLVRVATVKTRGSTMKQPITKLAMLPIQHEP